MRTIKESKIKLDQSIKMSESRIDLELRYKTKQTKKLHHISVKKFAQLDVFVACFHAERKRSKKL